MTWSKLSDDFFRHPKIVAVGKDARDLYMAALCHCNEHLTDGFVDAKFLRQLGASADIDDAEAAALLLESVLVPEKSSLWEAVAGGWMIHGFLEHNLSKADHEKRLQDKSDAGRRGGQRSGESRRGERPALPAPPAKPNGKAPAKTNPHTDAQPDAEAPAQPDAEAPAQPDAEAPAQPDGKAPAEADAQAKTKPVSGSVSGPDSRVPDLATTPPTSPLSASPPGLPPPEAPPPEVVVALVKKLTGLGVTETVASDLARRRLPEQIQHQIEWLPARIKDRSDTAKPVRDPAALLVKAIEDGYAVPASFSQAKQREAEEKERVRCTAQRERQDTEREEAERQVKEAGQARLQAAWDALPKDKRETVKAEATARFRQQFSFHVPALEKAGDPLKMSVGARLNWENLRDVVLMEQAS